MINWVFTGALRSVDSQSSPNTPGLRALQGREPLEQLLTVVRRTLDVTVPSGTPPLLLKIAPDLTDEDKSDIAVVVKSTWIAIEVPVSA